MTVLQTMRNRYSVRAYLPRAVEIEKINAILEAARIAPTAANRQPQRILVVRVPEQLAKFCKVCHFRESPLVFIVCVQRGESWVRTCDRFNAAVVDASIVTDHMMLEATELGLGSLWMSAFDPEALRREFSIPENLTPVNILCVGYADGPAPSPERFVQGRKPLEQIVFWERF